MGEYNKYFIDVTFLSELDTPFATKTLFSLKLVFKNTYTGIHYGFQTGSPLKNPDIKTPIVAKNE